MVVPSIQSVTQSTGINPSAKSVRIATLHFCWRRQLRSRAPFVTVQEKSAGIARISQPQQAPNKQKNPPIVPLSDEGQGSALASVRLVGRQRNVSHSTAIISQVRKADPVPASSLKATQDSNNDTTPTTS